MATDQDEALTVELRRWVQDVAALNMKAKVARLASFGLQRDLPKALAESSDFRSLHTTLLDLAGDLNELAIRACDLIDIDRTKPPSMNGEVKTLLTRIMRRD